MSNEIIVTLALGFISVALFVMAVRYVIRTYFKEKRAHLKAMLGANDSTNEKE